MKTIKHIKHFILAAGLALMTGWSASAQAGNLTLSQTPLFLGSLVPPNVFFELDDSGSMDWEVLTGTHWRFCAYVEAEDVADCDEENTDGLWYSFNKSTGPFQGDCIKYGFLGLTCEEYEYYYVDEHRTYDFIYDNPDNAYGSNCPNVNGDSIEGCGENAVASDWRILSSAFNKLYYNPEIQYVPWLGPCSDLGGDCGNASFSSVRSDPYQGKSGYDDTRNLAGFVYEDWTDDHGFSGARPQNGNNINVISGSNGEVDLWDSHTRYTVNGDGTITVEEVTYSPDSTGLNETVTPAGTLSGSDLLNGRTMAETLTNIANWYQYSRRRMFVAKGAVASVVDGEPGFRYGASVINSWDDLFVETPPASETNYSIHNREMLDDLFRYIQEPQGTPLREGLKRTGNYFDGALSGKVDPIVHSCQKNYTVLMTDGYYGSGYGISDIADEDGDGYNDTLADVARKYYKKDLSSLPNVVPPDKQDDGGNITPTGRQRMVTHTVAFGVRGLLEDTDGDGLPNPPRDIDDSWTGSINPAFSSTQAIPEKIDDLWHAAFNSKGLFFSADTPDALANAVAEAVGDIVDRQTSASSVALDSSALAGNSRLYQARFNPSLWTGDLLSYPISDGSGEQPSCSSAIPRGELCGVQWNAAEELGIKAASSRVILTTKRASMVNLLEERTGVPFRYDQLSLEQQSFLNLAGLDKDDAVAGQAALDYLRGDDDNEGGSAGEFRERDGEKLGDIIHSAPVFVGDPPFFYPDGFETESYFDFADLNEGRTPMVYVGANDGMLHGFHADTGEELLAYVPSMLYPKLHKLTRRNYSHEYYADGSFTVGDAFFGDGASEWRTVLVGTLRAGEQGVFALDVTDPDTFSEANADDIVLWEFTDAPGDGEPGAFSDPDIGFVFGRASIVKMKNLEWAVVFGNGYNNTEHLIRDPAVQNPVLDITASDTGNAVLYALDVEDGSLMAKIDTGVGAAQDPLFLSGEIAEGRPNGLAEATVSDLNGDGIADTIYAGDLFGNMWKFDVSSTNPAQWEVAFSGDPLFRATSPEGDPQPITSAPTIPRHPTDNQSVLVLFGTGKYFELNDNVVNNEPTQTFYAVYDNGVNNELDRNDSFVEQKITSEVTIEDLEYRITSSHRDPGTAGEAYAINWEEDKGWYMDLVVEGASDNRGERMVVNPVVRGDRVVFVTLIPESNECAFGGDSWLMEVEYGTGSRLKNSPFLVVNNDGDLVEVVFTETVGENQIDTVVSGRKFDEIINSPGIQLDPEDNTETKYFSGSSGNVTGVKESTDKGLLGRQSWRQLR